MSNTDLFTIRNHLQKKTLSEFKRIVEQQKYKLDINILNSLTLLVYDKQSLRKNLIEYLNFFILFDSNVVHTEVKDHRRIFQDLCYTGKIDDLRDLIQLFHKQSLNLQLYSLNRLISYCLEGKKSSDLIVAMINELNTIKKYFAYGGESQNDDMLVLQCLKKELLLPAYELLRYKIGNLSKQSEELFALANLRINKKDNEQFYKFIQLYLQKPKCNPRYKDRYGRQFIQYINKDNKDIRKTVQNILLRYQQSIQKKQSQNRRSQNKVRSSMGPGEHPKQYSKQPFHTSSKQKLTISIQSVQDELSIQRQANKIYQKHIIQKDNDLRIQKSQKKERPTRTGIIKSDQLRYYLQTDIEYEVKKIKDQNLLHKPQFQEFIVKLTERLTKSLKIQLFTFGSFKTQLCLIESDIDIVAVLAQDNLMSPIQVLQIIAQLVNGMNNVVEINLIKSASMPIIKITCGQKLMNKKIDITIKDGNHNGLESVKLIQKYLLLYPQVQPLIFVLKKFIYSSGLSSPFLGGLSSYALILMLVAHIQQQFKKNSLLKQNKQTLSQADLLISFLKFYGFKMNYVMKCIHLFNEDEQDWEKYTGCLRRYSDPNQANPNVPQNLQPRLIIIDPLDESNNVGRSTHKIRQIQMSFQIAYISIHTFKQCGKRRRCESYRRIAKCESNTRYEDNVRPCCILKRMFKCTQKFIKQ